ncbi:MAG: hypothetical protein HYY65_08445 [Candidatus Tectomicrobia bacterium]|uniref:Uncharacterized protein n=1 Tax=Tectimicrobiota bacterium TaxID=2528274 RepID=A0A932M100_UNCTE|nr:hypothetical protein [Candidatus Tectomicrobia bacterium]
MVVQVECYAGYRGNERPLRFSFGNRTYEVRRILDRWYGEDHRYFKVQADNEYIYLLKYNEAEDLWTLEWVDPQRDSSP